MENLLAGHPEYFSDILNNREARKVQIIYTRIDRKSDNTPVFTPYYFNVNAGNYFYPASTVKMPVALLTLEKLNDMKVSGLDKNSAMTTGTSFSGQSEVLNDPSSANGSPSVAQYIRKIFLVSDNDAYNRLYEFLGQEYINNTLKEKGYQYADILHRLDIPLTQEQNRNTNPVKFTDSSGNLIFEKPAMTSKLAYPSRHETVGKGYYSGGKLVEKPLDFSAKNRFSLEELTRVLQSVLFPASVPASQRFRLTDEDYRFVRKYMSELPRESVYPPYPADAYWDSYVKFLMYGSDKNVRLTPGTIRIFNKIGDAYGFLTDVAYVVDFEKGIEFMLSASIYCNGDEILNDDNYEYENFGWPFMKNLGQVIYDMESKRKKEVMPDLSEFKMDYGGEN
jgi:hypothetical protein